jgi:Dyp-type peroxidase family
MSTLTTADIQGNILIGYTYDSARHLFLRIDDAEGARAILRELELTSAYWPEGASAPPRAIHVGFTQRGLARLGCTLDMRDAFPAFSAGMAQRRKELGDSQFEAHWPDADVWLAIYANTAPDAGKSAADLLSELVLERIRAGSPSLTLVHDLATRALPRGETRYEHFGFQDNIGNPEIEGARPSDKQGARLNLGTGKLTAAGKLLPIRAGEFVLGYENEAGSSGPNGPLGAFVKNGTFAVLRQLEQDVFGFRQHMQKLADTYGRSPSEWASLIVGRTQDGTPLSRPEGTDASLNDFGYRKDGDLDGTRCPIGAHVRRAHPREASGVMDGSHRIMRRGMPYGSYLPEGSAPDQEQRGLCFVALNASIERQFEFIQQRWINASAGAGVQHDCDPLVGVAEQPEMNMVVQGDASAQRLPVIVKGIPSFVTCRGGAYFFMPSLSTFSALTRAAELEPAVAS